jgi:hypothetical protein
MLTCCFWMFEDEHLQPMAQNMMIISICVLEPGEAETRRCWRLDVLAPVVVVLCWPRPPTNHLMLPSDANHHVLYYFTSSTAVCKLVSMVYSHECANMWKFWDKLLSLFYLNLTIIFVWQNIIWSLELLELGKGISTLAWHIRRWPALKPPGGGADPVPKNRSSGLPRLLASGCGTDALLLVMFLWENLFILAKPL